MSETEPEFQAWAAFEPKGQLQPFTYTPRPLGPQDIEIKIHYCGICGSDVHQIDSGWGPANYPIVPGHEIIGEVTAIGSDVTKFKTGARVGVGPQCYSCEECDMCKNHQEVYCDSLVWTYNDMYPDCNLTYGGYAKNIRIHSRFVYAIPDNLPSEKAAPLLCCGVTTFQPLVQYGLTKGQKFGVIGIGGLGHMAIKWGRALGAHVVAISGSAEKEKDCLALGAHEFFNTKDKVQFSKHKRSFDMIIHTSSVNLQWGDYFKLVKPFGRFVTVGLPEEQVNIQAKDLIGPDIQLVGSSIGSPHRTEEMLKFAADHNITCDVQVWPIEKANEAIASFRQGKPRFRYVLKID